MPDGGWSRRNPAGEKIAGLVLTFLQDQGRKAKRARKPRRRPGQVGLPGEHDLLVKTFDGVACLESKSTSRLFTSFDDYPTWRKRSVNGEWVQGFYVTQVRTYEAQDPKPMGYVFASLPALMRWHESRGAWEWIDYAQARATAPLAYLPHETREHWVEVELDDPERGRKSAEFKRGFLCPEFDIPMSPQASRAEKRAHRLMRPIGELVEQLPAFGRVTSHNFDDPAAWEAITMTDPGDPEDDQCLPWRDWMDRYQPLWRDLRDE